MAYKYRQPDTILSPRDAITKVDVLFDNGEFSVAKLLWYGDEKLGIRWNIGLREWDDPDKQNGSKECLGVPTSRSHPTWFILPEDFINEDSEILKTLKQLKLNRNG